MSVINRSGVFSLFFNEVESVSILLSASTRDTLLCEDKHGLMLVADEGNCEGIGSDVDEGTGFRNETAVV